MHRFSLSYYNFFLLFCLDRRVDVRRHRGVQPGGNLRHVLHEPEEHRPAGEQLEQRRGAVPQLRFDQEARQQSAFQQRRLDKFQVLQQNKLIYNKFTRSFDLRNIVRECG
jgi:hypothetical protein